MNREDSNALQEVLFRRLDELQAQGSSEYARRESNVFANFERIAERTGLTREQVVLVYLDKHIDGIHAHFFDLHQAQREGVRGRIEDAMVYLLRLWQMHMEGNESQKTPYGFSDPGSMDEDRADWSPLHSGPHTLPDEGLMS